jgi:hypothetical protein
VAEEAAVDKVRVETSLSVAELRALIDRAHSGDRYAVEEMRRRGVLEKIAEHYGADNQTVCLLVTRYAGDHQLLREGLLGEIDRTRASLSLPEDSPAEKLLIEAAVMSWLFTKVTDHELATGRQAHPAIGQHLAKLAARAEKRMHASLRSLEAVRRFAARRAPAVRVEAVDRPRLAANRPAQTREEG